MHLTQQQIVLAVAIVVEVPSLFGLAVWGMYYGFQAMANIKTGLALSVGRAIQLASCAECNGISKPFPAANLRNWGFGTVAALLLPPQSMCFGLSSSWLRTQWQ